MPDITMVTQDHLHSIFPVFFSGKCGPGDLCFTMLEQMENIDTKLGDYGDAQIL